MAKEKARLLTLPNRVKVYRWLESNSDKIKRLRYTRARMAQAASKELGILVSKNQVIGILRTDPDLAKKVVLPHGAKTKPGKNTSVLSRAETVSIVCQVYMLAKELGVLTGDFNELHSRLIAPKQNKNGAT